MNTDESNDRIDDQCGNQHTPYKQKNQLAVISKDRHTAGRDRVIHQPHDTERCKIDDPADHFRYSIGYVIQEILGAFRCTLHCYTKDNRPEKDAKIIAVDNCPHRVRNDALKQCGEYITQRLRGAFFHSGAKLRQGYREDLTGDNSDKSRYKCRDQIEENNRNELFSHLLPGLTQCTGD